MLFNNAKLVESLLEKKIRNFCDLHARVDFELVLLGLTREAATDKLSVKIRIHKYRTHKVHGSGVTVRDFNWRSPPPKCYCCLVNIPSRIYVCQNDEAFAELFFWHVEKELNESGMMDIKSKTYDELECEEILAS